MVFFIQILFQAGATSRLPFYLFMIYVQLVKRKSYPLHYANAQLQLMEVCIIVN